MRQPFGKYPDPARFAKEIAAFEAADRETMPPAGEVVCVGSSTMRMWHATIREDLYPLTVIPRGFGGSTMRDLLVYLDRVVIPYRPRAVVIYEGDNDVAVGAPPRVILKKFRRIVARLRAELPEVRIYVMSIKPSPRRWAMWPQMLETNRLFEAECARDPRMTYIDVSTPLLDASGNPRPECYSKDRLHLTRAGYEAFRDAVRPVLHAGELAAGRGSLCRTPRDFLIFFGLAPEGDVAP